MAYDTKIETRLSSKVKTKFYKKAMPEYGMQPADLLRELVTATVEGRIRVSPPPKPKLYRGGEND